MASTAVAHDFQYSSPAHQAQTAIAGMWLFLATEVLLFGGLILCWIFSRHANQPGFDAGARETTLWIGTLNTALLVTSSFAYSVGLAFIRAGNARAMIWCLRAAVLLGMVFLALKFGLEWHRDFAEHLFPAAPQFKLHGAGQGGARLFFVFYFISTALHGVHMMVGIALVFWIIVRARRGAFSPLYHTPVQAVGLYWSFVDIVWLTLYPLIYLIGRG
ncbi:MAG TPA: cytochrome c oxidase subunit 3 [Steroidobacteraceae bacterium]|jgi:cytochrome c oxidase subunit 3|nr:cytochrome c oxidase subunit 3 [Steroidobacteraceae bacterium]